MAHQILPCPRQIVLCVGAVLILLTLLDVVDPRSSIAGLTSIVGGVLVGNLVVIASYYLRQQGGSVRARSPHDGRAARSKGERA